jgi:hypothetical protein
MGSIYRAYAKVIAIVKHSNLLISFLVVKVKHMLGVCLAGREGGRMRKMGSRTRAGVYISLRLVDTVWFLVRKIDPYYGKFKGILAD